MDKTRFLNVGSTERFDYTHLEVGGLRSSSWNNYFYQEDGAKYKFFGFQINVADKVKVNRRITYDLLNWLSNIGGLRGWLQLAGTFLCGSFASFNLSGLLANRIYKWQSPASFEKAVHVLNSSDEKPSSPKKRDVAPTSMFGKLKSKLKK